MPPILIYIIQMNLKKLIKTITEQEMANIGQAALFKEQVMQMVQRALMAHKNAVVNQSEFNKVIDKEIENIKAEMDLTFDMISRTLKGIPFHIFFKALGK